MIVACWRPPPTLHIREDFAVHIYRVQLWHQERGCLCYAGHRAQRVDSHGDHSCDSQKIFGTTPNSSSVLTRTHTVYHQ